jgi:two-component system cell cycle sensor histidine kinase PleC
MQTSSSEQWPKLLSLAVHELLTPVSVVDGYLRMLLRDTDPPYSERQRKMIDEAEKSCSRIMELVGELSDIGKFDAGLIALNRQPLDTFALVGDVANAVHEAADRDVRLTVRGDASGAPMTGDVRRLRMALESVFRAILREKPGPTTVVAERRRDVIEGRACAVLVVADEGRVQEAYAAPRGAFDDKRGGMGLALPLARRIIEVHDGLLWAPATHDQLARGSAILALPLTERGAAR